MPTIPTTTAVVAAWPTSAALRPALQPDMACRERDERTE